MKIGFSEAKVFLDNLKPSDNVCLIFHDDLDGLASGVLLYKWCEKKGVQNIKRKVFLSTGYIGDDHKNCNKIIVSDVFPSGFKMLEFSKDQQVLYTDHHPAIEKLTPPNVLEYRTTDEGYIPSSRTIQELTGLKKWIGVCGVLGDAGENYTENEEYIYSFLKERRITLGEFKVGVSNVISNCIIYFNNDLLSFFDVLKEKDKPEDCDDLREYSDIIEAEIEKAIQKYLDKRVLLGKVNYYFFSPQESRVSTIVLNIISTKYPNEIFMGVKASEKNKDLLKVNLRKQFNEGDLNEFIIAVLGEMDGTSGGGHEKAVGAFFLRKDLPKVKKRIEELSLEMFK